ncbi:unnamed protein product [Rotaria socialis]|uniref:Protein-glucosylgalactosylhydroxylysine glucosidase n=1 Tax=Rotaria socialis TaxID=392032 RepID=A0A821AC20_9BILA|nr:unnamed protein product [Rotaria socialis]CAF4646880.1 unnamed protein product [Rotaria socialis]
MSLDIDRQSIQSLLFANDSYVNPYDEHKNRNSNTRLVIVFIIMLFFLLILSSAIILIQTAPAEQAQSTTIFTTNELPSTGSSLDYRILPYIGNGHLATVAFSEFIYMNGLYNGDNGTSHRARIPSTLNWQFKINLSSSAYTLNVSSGKILFRVFTETIENDEIRIERHLFASQEYTELLIAYVVITRLKSTGKKIVVPIEVNEQRTSIDIDFKVDTYDDKYVLLSGETRQVENDQFQKEPLSVFVYYTPLPVNGLKLGKHEKSRTYLFVTSIDEQKSRAKSSFDYATHKRQTDQILSSHVSRWNDIWSDGHVEVSGDDELQRQINSAFYYILSSLPPLSTRSEHKQFYGLSPGSLSRGGFLGEDYGGHSFWDTETWMFPSVLLFYPTLAKEILSYRIALRDSAVDNARLFGYEGWRFPWESARTGVDVTPDCCPEVRLYQMHITGDIAFAARQYVAATGNRDWISNELGGDLIYESARFWGSRAVYNNNKKQYEILTVLPPDEDAQPFKNNSVFTNAVAALSIQLADSVSCITNKKTPQSWIDIASNLHFPFDNSTQTHLEYEGFDLKNTTIKQADVVLLGFPLMWPMSDQVRRNDLLAYEPLTRADGPAMTWSMHSIGFIELGDFNKAEQLFQRAYETYVRPPFNVWTEAKSGVGAVNFITGAGGFLQAVLYGYGGIRLKLDQLEFKPRGHLPNQATKLVIRGIKYQGTIIDLTIDNKMYDIFVRAQSSKNDVPLIYKQGEHHGSLKLMDRLSFPIDTQLIIRRLVPLCP